MTTVDRPTETEWESQLIEKFAHSKKFAVSTVRLLRCLPSEQSLLGCLQGEREIAAKINHFLVSSNVTYFCRGSGFKPVGSKVTASSDSNQIYPQFVNCHQVTNVHKVPKRSVNCPNSQISLSIGRAISKLLSFHPFNRRHVTRAGTLSAVSHTGYRRLQCFGKL